MKTKQHVSYSSECFRHVPQFHCKKIIETHPAPRWPMRIIFLGSLDNQMLHISRSKLGVRLQNQRKDSCCQRSRTRGPRKLRDALMKQRGGNQVAEGFPFARASIPCVHYSHCGRTLLVVARSKSSRADRADGYGVDT